MQGLFIITTICLMLYILMSLNGPMMYEQCTSILMSLTGPMMYEQCTSILMSLTGPMMYEQCTNILIARACEEKRACNSLLVPNVRAKTVIYSYLTTYITKF